MQIKRKYAFQLSGLQKLFSIYASCHLIERDMNMTISYCVLLIWSNFCIKIQMFKVRFGLIVLFKSADALACTIMLQWPP